MQTEVFIENYQLDISADISSLLTFELDNVKDFAARGTTWSKTIVLPGTANNNKLFGHIFQIGQANTYNSSLPNVNYNFNASKSAACIIFQDQMQTFKGVLRMMQINITAGRPEYEVAVFGEIAQLNVALNSQFIENLDFSAYNHVFNSTNVINSWDNTPGTGYYYPLIDYGQTSADKHDWDIRTFRPALYVREFISKMFAAANFRFSSAIFDTDRFKRLVIPHNQKELRSLTSNIGAGHICTNNPVITTGTNTNLIHFSTFTSSLFTASNTNSRFTYNDTPTITFIISLVDVITYISFTPFDTFRLSILKNGVEVNHHTISPGSITDTMTSSVSFAQNDYFEFQLQRTTNPASAYSVNLTASDFTITTAVPILAPISPGDNIVMNDLIPKNIRRIDFLTSIIKLFNLYVYEDRYDTRLIYITPYIDFYNTNSTDSVDWSYKLNRDKTIQIKPMSELNAKKYEFKYKSDSDYYNDLYKKRYTQGYGDYVYDSQYEFAKDTQSIELVFSATPLVGYAGEEKVISTIFKKTNDIEESVDSNIRILQTKKITGVASWNLLNGPSTILASTTNYGYGGHLNDPDAPSNDLNFGSLRELFFVLVSGDLTVTQFNVYWSAYMAEITDKDSKLVTAAFYLRPIDILQLDFSKKIYIDGILYRLNSIKDYNASKPSDCQVQLLKVNYLIY